MRVDSTSTDAVRVDQLRARLGGVEAGPFYLLLDDRRVHLCKDGERGRTSIGPEDVGRRIRGTKTALARACGARQGLRVLDAMAGYGVDGLVLASLGCDALLVERSPVVFTLLEDLVARWVPRHPAATVAIECGDGVSHFVPGAFDVIYLDPMFPPRSKSALPGKRLQHLHELVGATHDVDDALLERARASAGARVVLKRRRADPALGAPDWQIVAKTVRFDVYRTLTR